MALVDPLTSKQRTPYEELVAEFGKPDADTIRAVLEDACAVGPYELEWWHIVAGWMANMGRRSPGAIVQLALRIRAGATIPDEALVVIPPAWLSAAYTLDGLLARADQRRAELALAALKKKERRRRLAEGNRRALAALEAGSAPPTIRADLAARLDRAQTQVERRVERYARRLPARSAITSRAAVARRGCAARRRETSRRRRARAPNRVGAEGEPPQPRSSRRASRSRADGC